MATNGEARRGRLWVRALLVCSGLLAGLGIAEVLVRVLDVPPRMLDDLGSEIFVLSDNPRLRYRFRSNYQPPDEVEPAERGGRAHGNPDDFFRTNSEGFRDREFEVERRQGVRRIIVLGDSVTAGNGIGDVGEVFPRQLESLLNEGAGGERYEVYNMGTSGYETLQEVETLRLYGLGYEPDTVLVAFCMNDFWSYADGGALNALKREVDPAEYDYWLGAAQGLKRSRLAFVLYYRLRAFLGESSEGEDPEAGKPDLEGLRLLSELQAEHGFRAVVFVVPLFNRDFSDYGNVKRHHTIRRRVRRFPNIVLIDLLPRFRQRGEDAEALTIDGLHPNAFGHRVLAELMSEALRDLEREAPPPQRTVGR